VFFANCCWLKLYFMGFLMFEELIGVLEHKETWFIKKERISSAEHSVHRSLIHGWKKQKHFIYHQMF
jgi:hypothetical protein